MRMASLPSITNNPDVRFLGRLLGDVIRAYGGEDLFRRIEYIRSTSVDRHRGVAGADAIDPGLDRLSLDETIAFVRGFMLFSMLANLAEDRQGVAAEKGADVAHALDRLSEHGIGRDAVLALLRDYFGDCHFEKHNALPAECHSKLHTSKQRNGIQTNAARLYEALLTIPEGSETTPAQLREQTGLTQDQYKEAMRAASVRELFRTGFTTFGSGKNQKIRRAPTAKAA